MYKLVQLLSMGLFQILIVRQAEVRIIEKRGRFARIAESGISFLFSFWGAGETVGRFSISNVIKGPDGRSYIQPRNNVESISMRTQVDDYPSESVITKDNATIHIDAVVYYRIFDAKQAVYEVQDYVAALQKLVQSALRDECGKYELDALLTSRDQINTALKLTLDEATDPWGIKVDRVELKDIDLGAFGKILAEQRAAETKRRTEITEAEGDKRASILRAEGKAESSVTVAEGEKKASILRAEAAKRSTILRAEAEAILRVRQAEAQGFQMLQQAFEGGRNTTEVLRVLLQKATETGRAMAQGQATKIILPAALDDIFGMIKKRAS